MKQIRTLFFGSTEDSLLVLDRLLEGIRTPSYEITVVALVTQPPKPVGRKRTITASPVELITKEKPIPVCSFPSDPSHPWLFESEDAVANTLETFSPDLLVTASFGEKLPTDLLTHTQYGGINIHPSLLPRFRGADPTPWTILTGDAQTGVTLSTITQTFDTGRILASKKIPTPTDATPQSLRSTLFTLGATLFADSIHDILSGKIRGEEQKEKDAVYARKLTREDGYIPWTIISAAITHTTIPQSEYPPLLRAVAVSNPTETLPEQILRMGRALSGWPGIWTRIPILQANVSEEKRVKLLAMEIRNSVLIPQNVQLEGKTPVPWKQFASSYLAKT